MAQIKIKHFQSQEEVQRNILEGHPTIYVSSRTSTVIPYDQIAEYYTEDAGTITIGELGSLPKKIKLNGNELFIEGPVTWEDADHYLADKGCKIKTSPTDKTAAMLAGVATSCTGEHCFGYGTYRDHIISCTYLNYKGERVFLDSQKKIEGFEKYQKEYEVYRSFKNAPFPRLERQTDLMVGTEGQLGVVTSATIQVTPLVKTQVLFILLPRWEENDEQHLKLLQFVQPRRGEIISCELLDSQSLAVLEKPIGNNCDAIFLEVKDEVFEKIYEDLLEELSDLDPEKIFQIDEVKFQKIRVEIPRNIQERNSRNRMAKVGTDVQTTVANFGKLLSLYREFSKKNVAYQLFGHFGDCHLHFNFMPANQSERASCVQDLEAFYREIKKLGGSPFAEHGIGLLKQKFMGQFWSEEVKKTFRKLKRKNDPECHFFPHGFMHL
ncbi:MAG: FAD-binding oxidoreductase [Halobacteriovoraceae bacterium]|nr:FAD-binding oxidoreductase [Halobacteriovoraceae bacterium]MCB9095503.1 FAD-binding oxidoreductase [Halobacteriovoraceae bacterium]